ncbi:hypothetical protein K2X40_02770 [Candidatus Babeliales bacterium]|nr:hypothetical protein [Candidatus Babeliales bacterium]
MKNLIRNSLLITALAVITNAQADGDAHNQTYLNPRSHGVNLALENVNGWQKMVHRTGANNAFNGNLQVIGYYQASSDSEEIGEYFAPAQFPTTAPANPLKDNHFNFGSNAANTATANETLNYRNFVHQSANITGADTELVRLAFNPKHRAFGVTLNHHQDLDKLCKGLYFKLNVPFVNIATGVDAEFTEKYNATTINFGNPVAATSVTNALKTYFDGTGANTTAANAQAALQFLKFGKINSEDHSSGLADIDFILGYYFWYKDTSRVALNLGLTIPTGDEVKSTKLFEAIVGNGAHWAFGAGLDGGATMWQKNHHELSVHAALNFRYLFENTEYRTLGLKGADGKIIPWGHYQLVGQVTGAATTLIPAANKLTVACDVTPGSQLDGILGFAYHNRGFTLDLGYNLYYRAEEDVDRKGKTPIFGTTVNMWGIVLPNATANNGITAGELQVPLVDNNITTENAETPSQLTHKIYAGLAYAAQGWDVPLFIGINTHYEWASDNAALSNWGIGAKAGIGF